MKNVRGQMISEVDLAFLTQAHEEELEEVEWRAEERVERVLRQYKGLVSACLMLTGGFGVAALQMLYRQDVESCAWCVAGALICYGVSKLARLHWRDLEPRED